MVDRAEDLVRLAAEVRAEIARLDRSVAEVAAALGRWDGSPEDRLALYGSAALIDTFYTGVEKALSRLARVLGGLPDGPSWHRLLLEDAVLDLPGIRPPILAVETARQLEPLLGFRHRFRNLYLFDLEAKGVHERLKTVPNAWAIARIDIVAFAGVLDTLAKSIASGE